MELILLPLSVVSAALALSYYWLVFFFIKGWIRLPYFKERFMLFETKVSVIIPVRNEESTVGAVIEDVLAQNYPEELLELIIIDDHSSDSTSDIVRSFKNERVKLIVLNEKEPLNSYKKKAITEAIQIAAGELIITTDGDCRAGAKWVSSIVSFYKAKNVKLISGPVCFQNEKTWFEKIQTIEFLYLQGVGAASIQNNFPNTCNGANLAYTKEVFNELGGFKDIDDIASGDDELFLHKLATKYPDKIGAIKSRDAIVYTHAKNTLDEFTKQRKRWASKSLKYRDKRIVYMVLMIFFFNVSLALNLVLGFVNPIFWKIVLAQIGLKAVFDGFFIFLMLSFYRKVKYLIYLPVVMILYTVYILTIGFSGSVGKRYEWKGRMVR